MRYFLCIFLPPIAVLTTGKVGAFLLNIILTCIVLIPGIIHAFMVVNKYYADQRHQQIVDQMKLNRMTK